MSDLAPPLALVAELTHRCPLGCAYCSNPLHGVPKAGELAPPVWLDVLDQAARIGVLQVHFTGGEPLLRPDLEQLVERSAALRLYSNLITSGVPAQPGRLQRLRDAGLCAVQVSFQDADEAANDRAADLACYSRKLDFARAAKALGLPLTVNLVVTRQNADRVCRSIELAVDLGAERIELAHVQYHGWARLNRAWLLPTLEQVRAVRAKAEAARLRLVGRAELIHVLPDHHARYPKRCMGGWAAQTVVIAPDGVVLPCHAARALPLEFQSVNTGSLRDIWWGSPALQRYRGTAWLGEPCRSCERREIDLGGCRCQAFELTGDLRAADPVCERSPHHHLVVAARSESLARPAARPRRVLPLVS